MQTLFLGIAILLFHTHIVLADSSHAEFQQAVVTGIPKELPQMPPYETDINHAPKRKHNLTIDEKKLAVKNALRYFPPILHAELASEFAHELETYGHIYMYRFRPRYNMFARPISGPSLGD